MPDVPPGLHGRATRRSPARDQLNGTKTTTLSVAIAPAIATGALLGLFSIAAESLPAGWGDLSDLGGVWLVAAFAVGARVKPGAAAAAMGSTCLAVATTAYYFLIVLVHESRDLAELPSLLGFWGVVACSAGALFGFLGAQWSGGSRSSRAWATSLVSASLVGEALARLLGHGPRMFAGVLALELLVGLATPWALSRALPWASRRCAGTRATRVRPLLAVAVLVTPAATLSTVIILELVPEVGI